MVWDVFTPDAFGHAEMVAAIEKQPYRPGGIGSLGIFNSNSVDNKLIAVEEKDGILQILPTQIRGGDPTRLGRNRGTARPLMIPHVPVEGYIYPPQVAGVRAFGTEDQMQTIQGLRDDMLADHASSLDVTEEWHRLGCIKGDVLDADSSSILNLFTFFGVSQASEETFNLPSEVTALELNGHIANVRRTVFTNLKSASPTGFIAGVCGDNFFDNLVAHDIVRAAYDRWANLVAASQRPNESGQMGDFLRESLVWDQFPYQRVLWMNYRGNDDLIADMVDPDKCHFFPLGVPGLFQSFYAPSERYIDTVNTPGRPRFSRAYEDPEGTFVKIYSEMNDIHLCMQPLVLMQGDIGT